MNNLEKVKKWCEVNSFTYEEYIEYGILYIKNKITYEGFSKGKIVEIRIIEIMNMKECYLEEYLKYVEKELYTLN